MTKYCDSKLFLEILEPRLPLELVAEIATYQSNWCGATTADAYSLLTHWKTYKPKDLWPDG